MDPNTKIPEQPAAQPAPRAVFPAPTHIPQPIMPEAARPVIPDASQQRVPQEQKPQLDDKYAQALIHMVNANYAEEQAKKPKHHMISKRMFWLVILPTILSVIFFIFSAATAKNKQEQTSATKVQEQKLLDSGGFLKDAVR